MLQHFLGRGFLDFFTPIGRGREPIAVNQPSGGGSVYPFAAESDINHIVADAYLYAVGDVCKFSLPFSISWLYGFGTSPLWFPISPEHAQDILLVDAEGREVFNSLEAVHFEARDWGDRLRIYEWRTADPERLLRVVQYIAVAEGEEPDNFPTYYEPTDAVLDDRALEFVKPRLRSLRVDFGDDLGGKLRLANGYNLAMTTEQTPRVNGKRGATVVTIDAVPGSGRGKFDPGCADDPVLRTINGIRADDNGNFQVDGTECYRIERPIAELLNDTLQTVSIVNHSLQILNDCLPCCSCDDFINTYEGIRRLRNTLADLFERAHVVRDLYLANIERWNSQRDCRLDNALQITMQPSCNDDVFIAASLCNHSPACLENLVVIISFQYADEAGDIDPQTGSPFEANTVYDGETDPSIICGTSLRAGNFEANPHRGFSRNQPTLYPAGGTYPYFYFFWDRVAPGESASAMFNLDFPNSQPSDLVEAIVDAYSIPNDVPLPVGDGAAPVPGYVFGAGPLTAEAKSYRTGSPRKISAGLLQSGCCD